jgi:photosystem II stability/assembly factor-like uncharacterized protein
MKKLILLILISNTSAFTQTSWFSLSSETTQNLNSVLFIDNSTGFIIGDSGKILKTSNSGLNWSYQYAGIPIQLTSIFFLNSNTGYISGGYDYANLGYFLKTTNRGLNWIVNNMSATAMKTVYFTSASIGYIAGYNSIYKSINGGNTWSSQFNNNRFFLMDLYFLNSLTGFAIGHENGGGGIIMKTSNGGQNWNFMNPVIYNNFTSIQFINDSLGFISCTGGKIMKTTNGGNNWNVISVLGISDGFNSLFFTSPEIGFAVGDGSTIVKTTDGGLNWEAELSPSNQSLFSVYFSDISTGYSVGSEGTIIKTTNGSNSFSGININLKVLLEGMYYPLFNLISRKDTIKVILRETVSPYIIKDSAFSVIDSNTFTGMFTFSNTSSGNYYIVAKHFNSIETWSKSGGEALLNDGSVFNYDFTNAINKAYGNNLKLKGSKYCIYGGNVNGDAIVDGGDLSEVDNDSFSGLSGRFLRSDVNGDNIVDAADISLVDNNSYNSIVRITP